MLWPALADPPEKTARNAHQSAPSRTQTHAIKTPSA
jgi:hypothetical protein